MKKLFILVLSCSFLVSSVFAFRDIPAHSQWAPAIQNLIERNLFEDGTFFRPQVPVTADIFWPLVLEDAGFDATNAATFETPLPPNVSEEDPIAQYLREAIRRGFIDASVPFDASAEISRIDALKVLVKTKALPVPTRVSKAFLRRLGGVSAHSTYVPELESAYASHLLENSDVFNFKPHASLERGTLAQWIYNYDTNGVKQATLNPRGLNQLFQPPKKSVTRRNTTQTEETKTQPRLEIELREEKIPRTAVLQDVFLNLLTKYRFPETLTQEKKEEMIEAAITAMVKEMGDKFSSYIAPKKSQEFQDSLNGRFEGIGAHVEMIEDDFTITAPIKGSPAMKAGILAGDVVVKVNDEDIRGLAIMDIVNKIKGPAGTTVDLEIIRNHSSLSFTVERASITIPTIDLSFHKGVPVIAIHKFTASTLPDLEKILKQEVLTKSPRGIVLDVRNDPGGLLTAAVEIGELLTKKDTLLFSIDYKDSQREFRSSKDGLLSQQKNIVLLQNKGTASASEIVSSIIQDYNLGKIVGTPSFGKGTVQEVLNYTTDAILKITVARWLTPKGNWIQENKEMPGIIPDIEVSDPTADEIKNKIDRQLDMAVRIVLGQ